MIVSLLKFSGRPNPTWRLDGDLEDEVAALLSELPRAPAEAGLGYRGYVIDNRAAIQFPAVMIVHPGSHGGGTPQCWSALEQKLLNSAKATLAPTLRRTFPQAVHTGLPYLQVFTEPMVPYEPGRWNRDDEIILSNNCYSYAANTQTRGPAIPGRASNQSCPDDAFGDCTALTQGAEADGFRSVCANQLDVDPSPDWYAALFTAPDDFHWYRRDDHGWWSHKLRIFPVADQDENGDRIADPRDCARGEYERFCGFFRVRSGLVVR